jgi:hypothetical protein
MAAPVAPGVDAQPVRKARVPRINIVSLIFRTM